MAGGGDKMNPLQILSEVGKLIYGIKSMRNWLDTPAGQKAIDDMVNEVMKQSSLDKLLNRINNYLRRN